MFFVAIDAETGDIKGFTDTTELEDFARVQEYSCDYFEVTGASQLYLSDILEEEN